MTKPCAVASFSLLSLLATASCTSTSAQPGDGSAAGAAGSATGVGGAAGGGMIGGPSGLPVPPGPGGVPPPTGTPGNLHVLDWAGWKAAVTYTFDDAQPSQIEHYAELQATGAHFTFYITSGNSGAIGGFDSTFTQAVTDGHEMGNVYRLGHPNLPDDGGRQARRLIASDAGSVGSESTKTRDSETIGASNPQACPPNGPPGLPGQARSTCWRPPNA